MTRRERTVPLVRRVMRGTRSIRYNMLLPMLEGLRLLAQALPHRAALWLGRQVGRTACLIDARGRGRAARQLEQTGVGADQKGRRAITRGIYQGLGMNVLEWLHALGWTPEQMRRQVRFDALKTIEAAQSLGQGVIFVSAHMGNWELLPRVYHAYTGQTLAAVMAETTDPMIQQWMIRQREAGGNSRLLPVNEALAIFRHLRKGGALALLADQDSTRSRGIFVDFFGRPAYTPAGPAHLARRTGAPLVPVVTIREAEDPRLHRILMGEPILPDPTLEEEDDIQRITQAYSEVIEGWIRQYPAQWVWIHDRWRHRPGQKIRVRSAQRK